MSKSNSESDHTSRVHALEALIEGRRPITELTLMIAPFEFDSEPLITLHADHVIDKLYRFLRNELDSVYLEDWANLIEGRDDIAFHPTDEKEIKQAVHDLANPILSGVLDNKSAHQIISNLQQGRDSGASEFRGHDT